MFPVCRGQYLSKVVQGRTSGKLVTGSRAAKAQWCTWGAKAGLCGPNDELLLLKMLKKLMLVLIERCQNTQGITVCCIWGCIATDQSGCPCWPLSPTESINNGYMSIRTGPHGNRSRWPGLMNHVFFYITWVHVCCLHGEHMAPGCTMGRRQAGGGSLMLWAMFC